MYVDVSVFEGVVLVFYGHCMSERELEDALGVALANDIWHYLAYTHEEYPEYSMLSPDSTWGLVATINTEV